MRLINHAKKCVVLSLISFFNLFPIKANKIFLFSYYGSQYGCNPKYITEYILKNVPKDTFDLVWAFNDVKSKANLNGFRKVKTMSIRYFYELCTSKVIITNFRTTDMFVKRKEQYYIQTWHGSLALKHIEKDAEDSLPLNYIKMAQKDSLKCDLLISGYAYSTEIFKRAFWYNGDIFEYGSPRNDILFRKIESVKTEVYSKLNLSREMKVILYAPTFRKDKALDVYDLDYSGVLENMKSTFDGEWVVLRRLHPHFIGTTENVESNEKVIDVTTYDDVQELLSITDVLITDYSSLMFDFSITERPCFLYIPDMEDYLGGDRKLYFNVKDLPFESATSNDELLTKIANYNISEYRSRLHTFNDQNGTFEDGKACERITLHIYKVCFGEKKRSVKIEASY